MEPTICALATAPLASALAIIRISGKQAYAIVSKLTKTPIAKKGYTFLHTFLYDKDQIVDEVIILRYVAPNSYTGEDLLEINCHGSMVVVNKILALLIKKGAVLASKGEFSKRAFLHQKISIFQAQSINHLIHAQTQQTAQLAIQNIVCKNQGFFETFKNIVFDLLARIEVNIDYPEYHDEVKISYDLITQQMQSYYQQLKQIQKLYQKQRCLYYGLDVVLVGKPNVGKSALFNALIAQNKAIVSPYAGTTRDLVEANVLFEGFWLRFIDTAGINQTNDLIENYGINKTWQAIKKASLVLFVIEFGQKMNQQETIIHTKIQKQAYIIVKNKKDLSTKDANDSFKGVKVCAVKKQIKPLIQALKTFLKQQGKQVVNIPICGDSEMVFIQQLLVLLAKIKRNSMQKQLLDLLVIDLTTLYHNLCAFLGLRGQTEIINQIFAKFCVGK